MTANLILGMLGGMSPASAHALNALLINPNDRPNRIMRLIGAAVEDCDQAKTLTLVPTLAALLVRMSRFDLGLEIAREARLSPKETARIDAEHGHKQPTEQEMAKLRVSILDLIVLLEDQLGSLRDIYASDYADLDGEAGKVVDMEKRTANMLELSSAALVGMDFGADAVGVLRHMVRTFPSTFDSADAAALVDEGSGDAEIERQKAEAAAEAAAQSP